MRPFNPKMVAAMSCPRREIAWVLNNHSFDYRPANNSGALDTREGKWYSRCETSLAGDLHLRCPRDAEIPGTIRAHERASWFRHTVQSRGWAGATPIKNFHIERRKANRHSGKRSITTTRCPLNETASSCPKVSSPSLRRHVLPPLELLQPSLNPLSRHQRSRKKRAPPPPPPQGGERSAKGRKWGTPGLER